MDIETLQRELEALETMVQALVMSFTERTRCTVKVKADAYLGVNGEVRHSTMLHCGVSTSSGELPGETLCEGTASSGKNEM